MHSCKNGVKWELSAFYIEEQMTGQDVNSSSLILNPVHFSIISYLLKVYSILSTGNKQIKQTTLCGYQRGPIIWKWFSLLYIYWVTIGCQVLGWVPATGTMPIPENYGRVKEWTEPLPYGRTQPRHEHRVPLVCREKIHFNLKF